MIRFIRFYVIFWHNIAIEVKDFENDVFFNFFEIFSFLIKREQTHPKSRSVLKKKRNTV